MKLGVIIWGLVRLVAAFFCRRCTPESVRAVEAARGDSVRARKRRVNRRYARNKREGRLGGWYGIIGVVLLFGVSCRTTVDPPPRIEQYPVTSRGVEGWFVPAEVHADYVEAFEVVHQQKVKRARGCGCR